MYTNRCKETSYSWYPTGQNAESFKLLFQRNKPGWAPSCEILRLWYVAAICGPYKSLFC